MRASAAPWRDDPRDHAARRGCGRDLDHLLTTVKGSGDGEILLEDAPDRVGVGAVIGRVIARALAR